MRAVCPGSFDPVTLGHLDVITRAAEMFEHVVVGVGRNSAKDYLFSPDERLTMLAEAVGQLGNVSVHPLEGLLVDFCRSQGAGVIVKGVRGAVDVDFELQMAQMNHSLSGVETVLLPAAAQYAYLSSTVVRQVASLGGDVTAYVPPIVLTHLAGRARPA